MSAGHTPGPWNWNGGQYALTGKDNKTVLEACEGTVYSEYSADGVYIDCSEADACLIAAAPELLESLRGMLDRFDFGEQFPSDHPIIAARSAIAKATGKEAA